MAQAVMNGREGAEPVGPMTTADGVPLRVSLRRAERRKKIAAFLLVAPLLIFLLITFVMPIVDMAFRSVNNPEVITVLPRTVEALQAWDGEELPGEEVFAAFATDMQIAREERTAGHVGARLNYERSGLRSAFQRVSRGADRLEAPFKESVLALDQATWGDPAVWRLIQREARPYTASYYLSALDMTYDDEGGITRVREDQRVYAQLFVRTLVLSVAITFLTLVLGYPIAYLMATLPMRYANLLMILVLLPFWTSLLVRTTSWIVLLQQQGVLNDLMVTARIIADAQRLQMVHNWIGTLIAMTHILLPFMVLPLYSVMKTIPPSYMRAALSLGANPFTAFVKVYVPQTLPGIGAGGVLVFIISIGYYITPALVGGQSGQMISNLIAFHMQNSLNWGLAAALGTILLAGVIVLYYAYNRIIGADIKLG
jgi:putative spermidine/putrescine transport system permease protein